MATSEQIKLVELMEAINKFKSKNNKAMNNGSGGNTVLNAQINDCSGKIMIKTGARVSVMSEKFLVKNKAKFDKMTITTATGKTPNINTRVVHIEVQGVEFETTVLVVENLVCDVIIGMDVLSELEAVIDLGKQKLTCKINNRRHSSLKDDNVSINYEKIRVA